MRISNEGKLHISKSIDIEEAENILDDLPQGALRTAITEALAWYKEDQLRPAVEAKIGEMKRGRVYVVDIMLKSRKDWIRCLATRPAEVRNGRPVYSISLFSKNGHEGYHTSYGIQSIHIIESSTWARMLGQTKKGAVRK